MTKLPVDLFSDTATQPTPAMLRAMATAPLGDEQRGTDPTVKQLEQTMASLLGKERAVFVPTATMANQIAVALHCLPGDELICHETAHVINHEGGGLAANAGVQAMPLRGDHGIFDGDTLRAAIRRDDPHQPISRAVVVENTSNGGGGSIWPDDVYQTVVNACTEHGLALHIDGARLFNAAVARGVGPAHWSAQATTVQVCFSKGLGCPFGAVLGLNAEHEQRVRRLKQRMGGALRQAGVIAGAMLHALEHHVERLADDHLRAQRLAAALHELDDLELSPVQTNLIYMRYRSGSATELVQRLRDQGVLVSHMPPDRLRACLHLGISDADVDRAIAGFRRALSAG